MRLPVMPSLRYSCSGSPLVFSKGKTASESMILETRCGRIADVCTEEVRVLCLPVEDKRFAAGIRPMLFHSPQVLRPDSVSRFSRCSSVRMSAAF